ncbi:Pca regulon regulatory protein [Roseivivax sp. THAF40]|uniref:IclR family transcriptional regulator n=1 Tax=Roseivivax sp. THAF40 TaxID=2587858 RepID=UPI0012682097|nr:IclR family transcriptional regulator [Roseivivax sp. THAF40]QFT48009.1 Pca regulon regulatory protein [Roseivivax sp. THAF40]
MREVFRADPIAPPNKEAEENDPLFVRAAARAMHVLAAFNHASGPLSLSDIASRAGMDRSAAQRITHTLMTLGYLRRGPNDRGYLPGVRLLDRTLDVLRLDPVVQKATPVLLELRKTVRERVDLSLFDDARLIYALRMQSKRETFFATLVGHSVPVFCTAGGRAVLSALPDDRVAEILDRAPLTAYTGQTLTDAAAIKAEIEAARNDGFAVVTDEFIQGEIAIGVAIAREPGQPLGAIHVSGSLAEWSREAFVAQIAPLAIEAATAITESL